MKRRVYKLDAECWKRLPALTISYSAAIYPQRDEHFLVARFQAIKNLDRPDLSRPWTKVIHKI